jgi:2-oxoglutarate ferredoxin oxidoreductase subunit alpha
VIEEARHRISDEQISFLHFSQVYPLHPGSVKYLKQATYIICIENNATAQFASLIEQETGARVDAYILQYTGHPFSVESLTERIPKTINALEENS